MSEITIFDSGRKQVGKVVEVGEGKKNSIRFYGQHSDERILCETRPHPIVEILSLIKVVLAALAMWVIMIMIGLTIPTLSGKVEPMGFWIACIILAIGGLIVKLAKRTNVGYITDRRVVRFKTASPLNVNSRSLAWDEVVKVKTYSPNWILRLMNIGSIVVHAKSTVVQYGDLPMPKNTITDDDVELDDVYYYRDLGNYIDKILYLYKQKPKELENLKSFVAKPRGRRD